MNFDEKNSNKNKFFAIFISSLGTYRLPKETKKNDMCNRYNFKPLLMVIFLLIRERKKRNALRRQRYDAFTMTETCMEFLYCSSSKLNFHCVFIRDSLSQIDSKRNSLRMKRSEKKKRLLDTRKGFLTAQIFIVIVACLFITFTVAHNTFSFFNFIFLHLRHFFHRK